LAGLRVTAYSQATLQPLTWLTQVQLLSIQKIFVMLAKIFWARLLSMMLWIFPGRSSQEGQKLSKATT